MDILANIGLGLVGFVLGNLIFSALGQWVSAMYGVGKRNREAKGPALASAAFLHAGPWLLIAAGVFAYYVRSETWALPIFVGAGGAVVFFGVIGAYLTKRAKRTDKGNAA